MANVSASTRLLLSTRPHSAVAKGTVSHYRPHCPHYKAHQHASLLKYLPQRRALAHQAAALPHDDLGDGLAAQWADALNFSQRDARTTSRIAVPRLLSAPTVSASTTSSQKAQEPGSGRFAEQDQNNFDGDKDAHRPEYGSGPSNFSTFTQPDKYFRRHAKRSRRGNGSFKRCHDHSEIIMHVTCLQRRRAGQGLLYFLMYAPHPPRATPKSQLSAIMPALRATRPTPSPLLSVNRTSPRPSFAAQPSILSLSHLASLKPLRSAHLGQPRRALSTLPDHRQSAFGPALFIPLFAHAAAFLKSTSALHAIAMLTRVSLSIMPLSIRAKFIHLARARQAADPASSTARTLAQAAASSLSTSTSSDSFFRRFLRWNASYLLPALLLAPFVLFGAIVLASLERTPVTGRWRIMMLSPQEEGELVESILGLGVSSGEQANSAERDWVSILARVLNASPQSTSADVLSSSAHAMYSPTTGRRLFLDGKSEVLDERDWRVRWTEAVLRRVESGVVGLAQSSSESLASSSRGAGVLMPPPTKWPLTTRPRPHDQGGGGNRTALSDTSADQHVASEHVPTRQQPTHAGVEQLEYDLLVVDRDEANAFSFGFGASERDGDATGRKGVVVVYTGFLNQILGVSSLAPTASPQSIEANLYPAALPTRSQTESLAVLLSHEVAHLALSHTLETYASSSLWVPHLMRLGSDVLRTVTYPLTALLGPFVNDAISSALGTLQKDNYGVCGRLVTSCESRGLEKEADLVALRMLSHAGIDPRSALTFWQDRLALADTDEHRKPAASASISLGFKSADISPHLRLHSARGATAVAPGAPQETRSEAQRCATAQASSSSLCSLRSHPVDLERVNAIKNELASWERWAKGEECWMPGPARQMKASMDSGRATPAMAA